MTFVFDESMLESQRDTLYAAEEIAGESLYDCEERVIDIARAHQLATEVLEWAVPRFGITTALSIATDEEVIEGTSEEILEMWNNGLPAARAGGPVWDRDGGATMFIEIYTAVPTDREDGSFTSRITEHLILHEMAHVVVGKHPEMVDGELWPLPPDNHGPLFARRQLDIIEQFHPDCLWSFEDAYLDFGVEVADPDCVPSSWWNLPRPSPQEVRAAFAKGAIQGAK